MRLVIFDRDEVLTLLRGRRFCVHSTACIGPRRRWRRFRSVPDRIDSCDLAILRLRSLDSDFCDRSAPIFVFDFFSAVLRNFGQKRIYPSMSHASWALGSCLPRTTQAVRSRVGTPDQGRKFCWIGAVSSASSIKFSTSFKPKTKVQSIIFIFNARPD